MEAAVWKNPIIITDEDLSPQTDTQKQVLKEISFLQANGLDDIINKISFLYDNEAFRKALTEHSYNGLDGVVKLSYSKGQCIEFVRQLRKIKSFWHIELQSPSNA